MPSTTEILIELERNIIRFYIAGEHRKRETAIANAEEQIEAAQREQVEKVDLWGITLVRDVIKLSIEAVQLTPSKDIVLLSTLKKIVDKCEAALAELEVEDAKIL